MSTVSSTFGATGASSAINRLTKGDTLSITISNTWVGQVLAEVRLTGTGPWTPVLTINANGGYSYEMQRDKGDFRLRCNKYTSGTITYSFSDTQADKHGTPGLVEDEDGNLTVDSGTLTVTDGVVADLTGNVTGNLSGVVTGASGSSLAGSVNAEAGDTVALAASASLTAASSSTISAASGATVTIDPAATFTGDPKLPSTHDNRRWEVFEDFVMQTYVEADLPFILANGGGTTAADPALVAAAEGGVVIFTCGESDNATNDISAMVCSIPVQADSGGLVAEWRLHLNTDIDTIYAFGGFTDVTTGAELPFTIDGSDAVTDVADDALGFVYTTDAGTAEWFCLGVDESTLSTGNASSSIAPAADTYQTFRIEIDSGGEDATFYIDGTLVGTITANAIDVDVNLFFTIMITSTTSASKTADLDYIYLSRDR